jgi:hypothetical protein
MQHKFARVYATKKSDLPRLENIEKKSSAQTLNAFPVVALKPTC